MDNIVMEQEQQRVHKGVREAYSLRIEELKAYAQEDEIEVSEASEQDFWDFVESLPSSRRASLVLCDNGNMRAVWTDDNGGHVGIQFLGKQQAECVIFKRRGDNDFVSRVAGHDTLDGVKRLIRAFDLESLVGA